jgi:large subunit ribosomal protein L13
LAVEDQEIRKPIIVDASKLIIGRMSSNVAKLLLKGNSVVVINAEKALFSGNTKSIINERLKRKELKSVINPKLSPHNPRHPDKILHKIIGGMLPRRKTKGQLALKRLKIYTSTPTQYNGIEKHDFPDAKTRKPLQYYTSLKEVSTALGWRSVNS